MENSNPNPRDGGEKIDAGADGEKIDAGADGGEKMNAKEIALTRIAREMDRNANMPESRREKLANLTESERIDHFKEIVSKYMKSDEEKERERILEYTRVNYCPIALRREVYKLQPDQIFVESFRLALEAEDFVTALPTDVSIAGVCKFWMMSRQSCRALSREVQHFHKWCEENGCTTTPPSLYEHAIVVNGFCPMNFIDSLITYMEPVLKAYFPGAEIDSQFSFSVTLALEDGKHRSFDPNYGDDSDITIKLCLSDPESRGANLVFGERRCSVHETLQEEPEPKEMKVEMGEVVLHCGRQRNGFTPIEAFAKEYLIIWCKSRVLALRHRLTRPEWCVVCGHQRQDRLKLIESEVNNILFPVDGGSTSGESPAKKPKL